MNPLETRFRRLLLAYPAEHRHEYGDEMVGVLLAASAPDQRSPTYRDAVNLIWSGLITRLLGPARPAPAGPRGDAAVLAALLTVAVLAVGALRQYAWWTSWIASPGELAQGAGPLGLISVANDVLLRTGGWILVLVALLLGWRRTAIACGVAATLMEVAVLAFNEGTPWRWMSMGWLLVTAPVAVILLIAARHGHRPAEILGRRGVALVITGLLLCGMSGGLPYLVPGLSTGPYSAIRTALTLPMLIVGAFLLARGLPRAGTEVWRALLAPLAGLSTILVAQPVMEQLIDMYTRYEVTGEIVAVAATVLIGLPMTVMALAHGATRLVPAGSADAGNP
jgi:hypothetical protein